MLDIIYKAALIAALVFVVALVGLATWRYLSPGAQPHQEQHTPQAGQTDKENAENKDKPIFAKFIAGINRFLRLLDRHNGLVTAFGTLVIGFFTFVLFIATSALFYSSEKAVDASRKSADAAQKSADALVTIERPYLFMSTPKFSESMGMAGFPKIDFSLTNYGRTPAILRFYMGRLYTFEHPKQFTAMTWFNGLEVLKSGDVHTGRPFQLTKKFDDDPHIYIADQKKRPFLWLEVFYFDMFDYVHTSGFTFFYSDDGSGGKFVPIGGEKYSYRRAVKLPEGEWSPKPGEPPFD
jgi:hypothetical protein